MYIGPTTGHINGIAGPIDIDPVGFEQNINFRDNFTTEVDPDTVTRQTERPMSIPRIALYGLVILGIVLIWKGRK